MSEISKIVDKSELEMSHQVADLQVRAFLRLICQIGEVLDKQSLYAAANSPLMPVRNNIGKSTGTIENVVTSITDRDRTRRIFSRERKGSESGLPERLGQNHTGEYQDDEKQAGAGTSHIRALAETEGASTTRAESPKTYCNP